MQPHNSARQSGYSVAYEINIIFIMVSVCATSDKTAILYCLLVLFYS